MYSIQQTELFSFDQLLEMQPEDKYSYIFKHLNLSPALIALGKVYSRGRPGQLNYRAMIYSLLIAKMERIEFVKDIVRRLRTSIEFRNQCRFTGSDRTPSEASYSRLIKELERNGALEKIQDSLVRDAIDEDFISGTHLVVDSSPVEAWDCQSTAAAIKRKAHRRKNENQEPSMELLPLQEADPSQPPPKLNKLIYGRGRTTKKEAERRRKERETHEETLGPFEKSVEKMLDYTYHQLLHATPREPSRCAKKNSKGKMTSWYGYKANLLVDADSQYILTGVMTSAHLHDQRPAVVLLKALEHKFSSLSVKHVLGDRGYDCTPLYRFTRSLNAYPIFDYVHHTKPPKGYDECFRPLCQKGFAYVYDSFDPKYETIKYTMPKECKECPLAGQGCQKVHKIKMDQDIRKYTFPARGSQSYKTLFNKRSAVERVFAYLKEYFGLHRTRHRGKRANVDFQLSTLAYNLSKLALDKMNKQLTLGERAA